MSYLLHGQNGLGVEERARQIRSELDPNGFGTDTLEIPPATAAQLRSALQAAPFFGASRVVVVRGPAAFKSAGGDTNATDEDDEAEAPASDDKRLDWREAAGILAAAPPTTEVICWVSGTLPANHALLKTAKERGWKVEAFKAPRGGELLAWIGARATSLGVQIEPKAVEVLLDHLYPTLWRGETRWDNATINMHLVATELDKLAAATDSGRIDQSLVAELVVDRAGITAFRLGDQIFNGQVAGALVELDKVLAAGDPAERVVGQLAGEVAVRSAVRTTMDYSVQDVADALKVTTGRVTTAREKAARNDPSALADAAEMLRAVDASVKSGKIPNTTAAIVPLVAGLSSRFASRRGSTRGR